MRLPSFIALGLLLCSGTALAERQPGWDFGGELLYQFSQDISFDGGSEIVIYPGDLPDDPGAIFAPGEHGFRGLSSASSDDADYRFLRFRPPALERTDAGAPALPHIRLDRALEFLIGDRLR